jgi:Flp pilus assembly pilin Flp
MPLMLKRLWRNQSGQDLTEYGLLMVLVALLLVVGIEAVGKSIGKSTNGATNTL